jgi:hypothetical protein
MLRSTQDVVEIRRWAEQRDARPCRDEATGRLGVAFPGSRCGEYLIGWDEFESTLVVCGFVFVYDDSPSARRVFVGTPDEAHRFIVETCGVPAAPAP